MPNLGVKSNMKFSCQQLGHAQLTHMHMRMCEGSTIPHGAQSAECYVTCDIVTSVICLTSHELHVKQLHTAVYVGALQPHVGSILMRH